MKLRRILPCLLLLLFTFIVPDVAFAVVVRPWTRRSKGIAEEKDKMEEFLHKKRACPVVWVYMFRSVNN